MARFLLALVCLLVGLACRADDWRFTVVQVGTRQQRLELYLNDEQGRPLRSFSRLQAWLAQSGRKLRFAE